MTSLWTALLFASSAGAVTPCENITIKENECKEDGKASLRIGLSLPGIPDDQPLRLLELSTLRLQSTGEEPMNHPSFYSASVHNTMSHKELTDTAGTKFVSLHGLCGQKLELLDIAYHSETIDEITMDVQGKLSESATWLETAPEAMKHGVYVELSQEFGNQSIEARWAGNGQTDLQMDVFNLPEQEGAVLVPMGGSWSETGNLPVFQRNFFPHAHESPINEAIVQIRYMTLKTEDGICRVSDITMAAEPEKKKKK